MRTIAAVQLPVLFLPDEAYVKRAGPCAQETPRSRGLRHRHSQLAARRQLGVKYDEQCVISRNKGSSLTEQHAHASDSLLRHTWQKSYNRSVANRSDQRVKSRFPCGNCSSVFSMKQNLQYHCRIECGQPPRYNCPYCVYRTRHPSNVRAHVRRIHPGNRVYVVDIRKTELSQFS